MATRVKVTDGMLAEAVLNSSSVMGVLRHLGIREAGGSNSHYKRRITAAGFCMKHFTGSTSNKGKHSPLRRPAANVLVRRNSGRREKSAKLVRSLLEVGVKHECAKCGQGTSWLGNKLTLDVDHINEDWLDDRQENLRFLCPNCHSQFSRRLLIN